MLEAPSYAKSISLIGEWQDVDSDLQYIDYALSRNPTGFNKLPHTRSVFVVKTKLRISGLDAVPAYRMFVLVDRENKLVHKLWVELCPPAEMVFGDPFNDEEDEVPF